VFFPDWLLKKRFRKAAKTTVQDYFDALRQVKLLTIIINEFRLRLAGNGYHVSIWFLNGNLHIPDIVSSPAL